MTEQTKQEQATQEEGSGYAIDFDSDETITDVKACDLSGEGACESCQ